MGFYTLNGRQVEVENLNELSIDELRKEVKHRFYPQGGNKEYLIKLLRNSIEDDGDTLEIKEVDERKKKQIAIFDFEFYGKTSIELGIIVVESETLEKLEDLKFWTFFKSKDHIPGKYLRKKGITEKDMEDAPSFSEVREQIFEFLHDCGSIPRPGAVIDTFEHLKNSEGKQVKLEDIGRRFGFVEKQIHRSLDDCDLTLKVLKACFAVEELNGIIEIEKQKQNMLDEQEEKLEAMNKMRNVLREEVLEDRLEEKEVKCSELQKKSKRLEDSLINEKKLTSQRRKELTELHKSFTRVRECTDNLKNCEQELQSLVNSAAREGVAGDDED